ncbi:metalloregulator ArsR/SmtB family transcription factor [Streptomyces sp. AP-93]|uniref:metalloregulator ArsR/SmtB family transcription factor n=1 Tax=Streptomyces sp. AP-93 TaxID=2929048 RepID=UPI001FAF5FA2|nr:metalloregulator ArsR/SmtB family transcription factor [Streptomyces sp. AP-93]MCJ0873879.1 metalloregulator ArsR/SmtB family transcription factor [Streptomyces sp. AP-93]
MGDPTRKAALFDAVARTGKALSNGKRLELLDLLAQGERSVDALAKTAGLGLTTASAHLQTLKQAGLVATRRDGVRIHYRLAGEDVAALYALLQQVSRTHLATTLQARSAYLGPEDTDQLTREELLERVKSGTATVIDVRPAEEYDAGHIPGSLSIPLDQLEARLAELPDDAEIVAYCRGTNCVLSHDAVRLLAAHGRQALRLADGMLEWRLHDLPVEAGAA